MPGIDECLLEAMSLPGARGAAVVEWTSGLALGTVGDSPNGDHEATAAETAELARMAAEHAAFAPPEEQPALASGSGSEGDDGGAGGDGAAGDRLGKGTCVEDVIVTTRTCYHLMRFVDTSFESSVFLHIWLDRYEGNLALARLRMRDLAQRLALV